MFKFIWLSDPIREHIQTICDKLHIAESLPLIYTNCGWNERLTHVTSCLCNSFQSCRSYEILFCQKCACLTWWLVVSDFFSSFTPSKLRQPLEKFFDVLTGAVLKIIGCSDTSRLVLSSQCSLIDVSCRSCLMWTTVKSVWTQLPYCASRPQCEP